MILIQSPSPCHWSALQLDAEFTCSIFDMSNLDNSCVLGPLSPTYMPYFPPHHSPLHSSSNTRQRDDYELSSQCGLPSRSPQVLVTLTDDEDYDVPPPKPDRLIEGYPAWELPFASEPALEGELEQGLPPLKKLKPDSDYTPGRSSSPFDQNSAEGIVLIRAVKGILTRRTVTSGSSSSTPHSPSASSPISSDTCFVPWTRSLGLGNNTLSTIDHSSAPLSRRSSSGGSSICAGSLKAVRFASGNGFGNSCSTSACDQSNAVLPREVEGPVAAIMYLTHSAEAYDRSPIIVEDGLRLPPRAKHDDEDDAEDDVSEPVAPTKRNTGSEKKRRAKMHLRILDVEDRPVLCTSPDGLSPRPRLDHSESDPSKDSEDETSIVIKPSTSSTSLAMSRTYREKEEVDEEEEDETAEGDYPRNEDDEDEEDMEGNGADNHKEQDSDDDDDHHDHEHHYYHQSPTRRRNNSNVDKVLIPTDPRDRWGLGKWSSGEVFGSCDVLGGF